MYRKKESLTIKALFFFYEYHHKQSIVSYNE